ncbi:MAG: hypothetical protein ACLFUU_06135 [Desulfobacteraceae bacterium]
MLKKGIRSEIRRANRLYERFGEAIRRDRRIGPCLDCYGQAIRQTRELNRRLGITAACTVCAREGPGSCCFPGVENQYDWGLLLVNRLLGVNLPESQEISGKCFFLGPWGCKLMARHYYCQRFLCPELQERLGPALCQQIRQTIEAELAVGWELEQSVSFWVKGKEEKKGDYSGHK